MEVSTSKNIADILNDIESEAVNPHTRFKSQAKDYSKENIRRIRQMQFLNRRHNEELQTVKPTTRPDKYSHIQAKVTSQVRTPVSFGSLECKTSGKSSISPERKSYSTIGKDKLPPSEARKENNLVKSPEKVTRPPSVSQLQLGETDYVKSNIFDSKLVKAKRNSSAPSSEQDNMKKYQRGTVPKYLLQRQKELLEEKQRQMEESKKLHLPGYTIMPEKERQETLTLLRTNEQDLLQQLSSLPVGNDTLRIRQMKETIEKQLTKIDEGIKIFSQNKVLIKNE